MSKLFSYPDDPQEYRNQVAPQFEAAKKVYPGQAEGDGSTWSLTPNLMQPGELVLAEHCQDDNPHPIHHWQFRVKQSDL